MLVLKINVYIKPELTLLFVIRRYLLWAFDLIDFSELSKNDMGTCKKRDEFCYVKIRGFSAENLTLYI